MAEALGEAPDASIDHAASIDYWNSVESTVNGMLGGFPHVSRIDLQGSSNFYNKLRRLSGRKSGELLPHAVDCGAGIGRIALGFLVKIAQTVDVVEPVQKFTDQLKESDAGKELVAAGRIGTITNVGLENWSLDVPYKYDLIWNQWCVGHLTDAQLVEYLNRCRTFLAEDGFIVVKENMSTEINKQDLYDPEDSSVTRADEKFRKLFDLAGLHIFLTEVQRGFPKELYPVRVYALRPKKQ